MIEEQVILVNEKDEQIGLMPKQEAHEKAVLHREILSDGVDKEVQDHMRLLYESADKVLSLLVESLRIRNQNGLYPVSVHTEHS